VPGGVTGGCDIGDGKIRVGNIRGHKDALESYPSTLTFRYYSEYLAPSKNMSVVIFVRGDGVWKIHAAIKRIIKFYFINCRIVEDHVIL